MISVLGAFRMRGFGGLTNSCLIFHRNSEIEHPEFASIAAKLRIGKKYDIDYQYNEALKYLQSKLPSSLENFQALQSKPNHRDFRYSPSILLDVIRLALETNTLSILPAAYLHLGDRNVVRSACTYFWAKLKHVSRKPYSTALLEGIHLLLRSLSMHNISAFKVRKAF